MDSRSNYSVILAPREVVNDDFVLVVEWLAPEGAAVHAKQPVVTVETSKSTFDVESPVDGFLFPMTAAGAEVPVGSALALVSPTSERPRYQAPMTTSAAEGQVITKKARELIDKHAVPQQAFASLAVVRTEDVEAFLVGQGSAARPAMRHFGDEALDPAADWDPILQDPDYVQLREVLIALRKRMRARFNRHVPIGTLLNDRWELARECRFGEGTSIYDECLILGEVQLGKYCWVGPYAILDGSQAPLTVGDYVDVGAGTHIYTHNSIERALTGHKAPMFSNKTTIGDCCFIAPQSIISPGTVLGDHCFVAAGSYVEGHFPAYSNIAGTPARVVGSVEVNGNRARIRHHQTKR